MSNPSLKQLEDWARMIVDEHPSDSSNLAEIYGARFIQLIMAWVHDDALEQAAIVCDETSKAGSDVAYILARNIRKLKHK